MNDEIPNLPTYLFEPNLQGLLSLFLTFILPIIAALLIKSSWAAPVKGVVLLALSGVKAFAEAWIAAVNQGEPFAFYGVAYAILINFGIAVVSYFGILKGTNVQQRAINGGLVKDHRTV